MIDTIKLTLPQNMFIISEKDRFQKETMNACRGYFKLVQNPTREELKIGTYKPRLTLTKRRNTSGSFEPTLSIELSLPKLLFGNNFDELDISDFDNIIEVLVERLKQMGILVFSAVLKKAPVSSIHYSKNIPLLDGTTPHMIIEKIKQANIPLSLDINQTDYRNDGYSYKWHANSYEVAFYDKIKDIEYAKKSDRRSFEKDNSLQLELFDLLNRRKCLEVLRMEVRLNKRQKIAQILKRLNISAELIFKDLFSTTVSQRVLLYYLGEIENKRLTLLDYKPMNAQEFLTNIIVNNPKISMRKLIQTYGFKQVIDKISPRELRVILGKYSKRSWYRLMAEGHSIKLEKNKISPLKVVHDCLIGFKPLKLVDYNLNLLNNDKNGK